MPSSLNVLITDNNLEFAHSLGEFFEENGHTPDFAYSGSACLELLQQNEYDALVLDVGMPHMNGWEVCRLIRQKLMLDIPIIFLTAYDSLPDKSTGYDAGADDYLGKPFPPEELIMRIQAITKRGRRHDLGYLQIGDLTLDLRREQVKRQGVEIKLSSLELQLLLLIIRAYPNPVSKQTIITTLWSDDENNSLRTHIYRLRCALEKQFDSPIIETVYNQGYRFIAYGISD